MQRMFGEGTKVKGAIKSILNAIKQRPRDALNKWKSFISDIKTKKQYDNARTQQLKNILEKIPRRTIKDVSERLQGEGDKVKGALKSIVTSIKKKTQLVFQKWDRAVKEIASRNLLDNVKSQKLKFALSRIPMRTLRDSYERIIGDGSRVKGSMNSILHNLKRRPKNAIELWKKFNESCKKKDLFDNVRSQKLKICLTRLPLRTVKDTYQRVAGGGSKAIGALKLIFMTIDKQSKRAFFVWRDFLKATKTKGLLNNIKSQKLKDFLGKIPTRTLLATFKTVQGKDKDTLSAINAYKLMLALQRVPRLTFRKSFNLIFDEDDKVRAALIRIINFVTQTTRRSFFKWTKFVDLVKQDALLDNIKSEKLLQALNRVPKRTLRTSFETVIGDGSKARGLIGRVVSKILRRPRTAIARWVKYANEVDKKNSMDAIKTLRLKSAMENMLKRTLRNAERRIVGAGDIIKGALTNMVENLKRKPRNALRMWKNYVTDCDSRKILDSLRTQKLKEALNRVPKRTLRDAVQRIAGDGSRVKGALNSLLANLKRRPREALSLWRDFVARVNRKEIIDNVRSQKLKIALIRIPVRGVKDCYQRIVGMGDKTSGALKTLFMTLEKQSKRAFYVWKDFSNAVQNKTLSRSLVSERLKNALTRLPFRTLRATFELVMPDNRMIRKALRGLCMVFDKGMIKAVAQWKTYLKDSAINDANKTVKAMKIKDSLQKPSRRVLRSAKSHADHDTSKLRLALKTLGNNCMRLSQDALKRWVLSTKPAGLLNKLKGNSLYTALSRVPKRTMKSVFIQVISDNRMASKILEYVDSILQRKPRSALNTWRKFASAIDSNLLLNNIKALKLQKHLEGITRPSMSTAYNRLLGMGDRVKGVIMRLSNTFTNGLKASFHKWLLFKMACDRNSLMNATRTQLLKITLSKLQVRTMRQASSRVVGAGSAVEGTVTKILKAIEKMPQVAFRRWKDYLEAINKKQLFDAARSQKLANVLSRVESRTLLTVMKKFNPDHLWYLKKTLNNIVKAIEKRQQDSYNVWKAYLHAVNSKKLMDQSRSYRLKSALSRVDSRSLRDCLCRVIGGGDKAAGRLESLCMGIKKWPKVALDKWKRFVQDVKNRSLLDNIRTLKLKEAMQRILARTSASITDRVLGDGSRVRGALRRIFMISAKTSMLAFSRWVNFLLATKQKTIMNNQRGMSLKRRLEHMTQRSQKSVIYRLVHLNPKVLQSLHTLALFAERVTRNVMHTWRKNTHNIVVKKLKVVISGEEFINKLERLKNRACKEMFTRMFDHKGKVAGIIERLIKNYQNMQKDAYMVLWGRVEKIRTIKKINSAYYVFRSLMAYAKRVLAVRFKYWKNLEYLRRRRIMKKSAAKMMAFSSVSYESAFWKWKYVISATGAQLNPKHSLVFKRMILISTNYQKRLEQFSFYKLALFYKNMVYGARMSIPQAIEHLNRHSRDFSVDQGERIGGITDPNKSAEPPSNISTVASGKLSKDEVSSMNQLGGLEMMFMQLKEARIRNLAWGLCSLLTYSRQIGHFDNERGRLIDQINELRFEKHSLLEDNNTLRHHNESLIENLEKTNLEFQTLSLHLDQMRLVRMVRVVSKMIEVPMAEAFSFLYENNLY